MAKVDPEEYGGKRNSRPYLTPELLGDADVAVLMLDEAKTDIVLKDGKKLAVLVFEEYPKHDLWLSQDGIRQLVSMLGNDDANWPGHMIPLVRVRSGGTFNRPSVVRYHVAPAEDWEEILDEYNRKNKRTSVAPERVRGKVTKRGSKKK